MTSVTGSIDSCFSFGPIHFMCLFLSDIKTELDIKIAELNRTGETKPTLGE